MSCTCCVGWLLTVVTAAVPIYYFLHRWAQGGEFRKDDIRIDGKVVIITGANTGIGKETALDLAKRGGRIYLACRDVNKAKDAQTEIIEKTGNQNVFVKKLDLSSFDSIQTFVADFKRCETKLHILINNAGVMGMPERETTQDGLELHIGTNHFGHFLLTNLLLDVIKASAPARIVVVSSMAHQFGSINRDDLQSEKSYNRMRAYGASKLANILFSRELAKRLNGTGVTVNSLHPGVVQTELMRHFSVIRLVLAPFSGFVKTPRSGAQTTNRLAVDPELDGVTGKYFSDCKVAKETDAAKDDDTAKWLWNESEKLTHLKEAK